MPNNSSANSLANLTADDVECDLQILDSQSYHFGLNVSIIVINTPFVILTVFSNLVVLITVSKFRQLHIPANVLLCSLALTDLLVGLVTQPLFIAWRLMLHYRSTVCRSELVHSFYEAFLYVCTGGSFLCLAYISSDRLMAVSRPLHYRANVTTSRTMANMTILWIVWSGFIILRYSGIDEDSNKIITSVIAGALVIYLLIVQVALMVRIKKSSVNVLQADGNNAVLIYRREKRCAVTILYIFLTLVIFLLPAVIAQIATGFTSANHGKTEMNLAISALLINSSVNPLIYFWRNSELRKATRRLFKGRVGNEEGNICVNSARSVEESL